MRKVIGLGETVYDVIFRDDQPTAAVPGGSTFNAMISLGRTVGVNFPFVPLMMITETGDDHIGDIIVDFMRKNNLSTETVVRNKGTQSHISMAFLDKNNDAHYQFYKDHAHANLPLPSFLGKGEFFKPGDILLFGSFFAINPVIRETTRSIIKQAHDAGAILYYDINFRKSHIKDLPDVMVNIEENCRMSDIVRGSSDDFHYLYGTTDAEEIYRKHIEPLCKNFIYTSGGDMIEVFSPGFHCSFKPLRAKTVSTIGAGDNFNAGIIYSLIRYGFFKEADGELFLNDAGWRLLVGIARKFSAAVVRSINNYVDEGFCGSRL